MRKPSSFVPSLGYGSARGYQYGFPQIENGSQGQTKKFSFGDFLREVAIGGITGGLSSAAFYGAGKGIERLKEGLRPSKRSAVFKHNALEEMPSDRPQYYTSDLSQVTGKSAKARQRAIDAILKEDFPDLNLSYKPEYNPFIRTGVAQQNTGTQIGKNMFISRDELRDTIIHEELHHRWWKQGIYDHHPVGTDKEAIFYEIIRRYKEMRGWN